MQNRNSSAWCPAGAALALVSSSLPACKAKLPEELPAPATSVVAEPSAAPASTGANGALPPALGAPGERPSLQQNMGRGFQGRLTMRLQSASARHDLRYLSLGNTARLQVDAVEEPQRPAHPLHFDALLWGDNISLLDHGQRTVRTLPLRQIRPKQEPTSDVETHQTGERSSIQGVFCEAYQIQQGPIRIDACVGGLPGEFDVDKFEAVSGIDVPSWVEELLKRELLPLRAVAHDAAGAELYRLELVEYSPGPVDDDLLTLPPNYQPAPAQNAVEHALSQGTSPGGQP